MCARLGLFLSLVVAWNALGIPQILYWYDVPTPLQLSTRSLDLPGQQIDPNGWFPLVDRLAKGMVVSMGAEEPFLLAANVWATSTLAVNYRPELIAYNLVNAALIASSSNPEWYHELRTAQKHSKWMQHTLYQLHSGSELENAKKSGALFRWWATLQGLVEPTAKPNVFARAQQRIPFTFSGYRASVSAFTRLKTQICAGAFRVMDTREGEVLTEELLETTRPIAELTRPQVLKKVAAFAKEQKTKISVINLGVAPFANAKDAKERIQSLQYYLRDVLHPHAVLFVSLPKDPQYYATFRHQGGTFPMHYFSFPFLDFSAANADELLRDMQATKSATIEAIGGKTVVRFADPANYRYVEKQIAGNYDGFFGVFAWLYDSCRGAKPR